MGPGYTLLFTFTKLAILMGLFPIVVYGFFMMAVYMGGNTCVELDQLLKIQSKVSSLKDLPLLESLYPVSAVPGQIRSI